MEDDKPTGVCPECGQEYFCLETTCDSGHPECDVEELEEVNG